MVTSSQEMPKRLELFFNNLNKQNMRRRLFYIYKWMVGRREANRNGYLLWLQELSAWFANHVKEEGFSRQNERAETMRERLMNKRTYKRDTQTNG